MRISFYKSIFTISLSFIFLLNLSSCATLSESECQSANWEIIGLEDGSRGYNTSYIGQHRKACSDYGIAPNLEAYLSGHQAGIKQFCTEDKGYKQGLNGKSLNENCPLILARAFKRGYHKGLKTYRVRTEISNLRHAIHDHEERLEDIIKLKPVMENELISNNTGERRRRELLEDIKELERDSESIHIEIHEMQAVLIRLEDDYERVYGYRY